MIANESLELRNVKFCKREIQNIATDSVWTTFNILTIITIATVWIFEVIPGKFNPVGISTLSQWE
jgi:hypothetical protein